MDKTANKPVTSQIRLSEELYAYVKKEAAHTGMSMNSVIIMLMSLGAKVYDGRFTTCIQADQAP